MNLAYSEQALKAQAKAINELEEARDIRCRGGWIIRWHSEDEAYDQYLAIEKEYGFGWGYEDYWYITVFDNEEDANKVMSLLEQHYPHSTFSLVKNDYKKVKSEMNERIYALRDPHKLLCKIVNYFRLKENE